jgi:DNA-binding NarL/FixJ family response regulator
MPSAPIRISLVEDQREIREGLTKLIAGSAGFTVCGVFASMEEAIPNIGVYAPQVALIDLGLPGISGADGIRIIRAQHPEIEILVLSVYDDDDKVFEAICAGACGFLLKKTPSERLLESIREVVNGGAPMSPEIARKVLLLFRNTRPPQHSENLLTPHELRLLRLLVEGHNYKTAALELNVTVHAVSFHMRHVYQKLEVHSKSEAVAKALRDGLVR